MPRHPRSLYALPFGDEAAVVQSDIKKFSDNVAKVVSSLNVYDSRLPQKQFAAKSSVLFINGLKIAASANTPITVDVGHSDDVTLMIPFNGVCHSTFGNTDLVWGPKIGACFLPSMERGGYSDDRSLITLTVDARRLKSTIRTMYGFLNEESVAKSLSTPQVIPLQFGEANLLKAYSHLCKIIDAASLNAEFLRLQGVDDMFYRNMAIMLQPDLVHHVTRKKSTNSRQAIDRACDYALANLANRITLTDLEIAAKLSQRGLHNAFVKRFDMSPMQWVKEQRLLATNTALKTAKSDSTVTSIAMGLGFYNLGPFSAEYKKRFGESPSQTLKQASR